MSVTFKIDVGTNVRHKEERYVVIEVLNLHHVTCRSLTSKRTTTLPVQELVPDRDTVEVESLSQKLPDFAVIPNERWAQASTHLDLLRSLAEKGRHRRTKADIEAVARTIEKSPQTVYRWLQRYEKDGTIAALFRKERSDKGGTRLVEAVEGEIKEAIKRNLLKRECGTIDDVHREVKKYCIENGFKVPAHTTIRDRFFAIPEKERVKSQKGRKVAKEKYSPLRGAFPGADYPLAVVQIDHTPADLIIVDEIYRKPIGRPTLTLAIDVYSRMVFGFNMWLEAPSAASVGHCLYHAMMPKEKWLEGLGMKANWPCYGKPRKIHTDNAKEFRGTVLGRACKSYGIDLEQRPKGEPHFGGHIERGFRTFLRQAHKLRGTTFSNVRSKFEYDSRGRAILTLKEFQHWFTVYIAKIYHNKLHTGVQTTPLRCYKDAIIGVDGRKGIGLPERILDEKKLWLDFMPFVERTIQEYGVLIDHIYYYSDVLRHRINEVNPDNPKEKRLHLFRRDPTDISIINFWDPDLKSYAEIPYKNTGRPPVSTWEVSAVVREIKARGRAAVDENAIFEGIEEMREIEREAARKSVRARRNEERRRQANNKRADKKPGPDAQELKISEHLSNTKKEERMPVEDDEEITPFDDIDMRA